MVLIVMLIAVLVEVMVVDVPYFEKMLYRVKVSRLGQVFDF